MKTLDKKMKRGFVDLPRILGGDEEAEAKLKHKNLLKDYLVLQKEFVSKKRKLKAAREKRGSLLSEVIFLRQRRRYMLKHRVFSSEAEKDVIWQNSDTERAMPEEETYDTACEAAVGDSSPVLISNLDLRCEEGGGRVKEEKIVRQAVRVEKMPRNYLTDDKVIGTKKISRNDQVTLKV